MRSITPEKTLPLVYSCSGCSSAAQMANQIAVRLDRAGQAEMSCIAGVGGDVPALVHQARSGRFIVAIDGCALNCARHCLARHGIKSDLHVQLQEFGVRKVQHQDFDPEEARRIQQDIAAQIQTGRQVGR